MQLFFVAVVAKVLEWLLSLGGKALYESVTEFVEKQRQKKKDKDNIEAIKKAIQEKKYQDAADEMARLANGQGKK